MYYIDVSILLFITLVYRYGQQTSRSRTNQCILQIEVVLGKIEIWQIDILNIFMAESIHDI